MTSISSASVQHKNTSGKGRLGGLGGGAHAPHNPANAAAQRGLQPDSPTHIEERSEYGSTAVGDSAPVVSSFDDDEEGSTPQLGYKDELEVRFIWDRVLETNKKEGFHDRVVVDRYSGTEYVCRRLHKAALPEDLPANATPEQKAAANDMRMSFIKQQITKFTKLSASLNVSRLEQVYEDNKNVYLVIEKLNGPSVEELMSDGALPENDVKHIMRGVVRVLAQCHDAGFEHGAVEPSKFRLLSEDRRSPVKATAFGPLNSAGAKGFLGDLANMAPENLSSTGSLGRNADTWAMGLMATRALTEYFPFDDVLSNAVDSCGVLQPLAPLTEVLDNNPLMPSGAALFVSATVMLLDFSRPHWGPISSKGKDWVLKCLKIDPEARWSPMEALEHMWLKRETTAKTPSDARTGVVQRIQRFGNFNEFKRSALEQIAHRCFRQSTDFASRSSSLTSKGSRAASARSARSSSEANNAVPNPNPDDTQSLFFQRPNAAQPQGGSNKKEPSMQLSAGATMGASKISNKLGNRNPAGMQRAKGLLEHLMVDNGAIDRFSLSEGLSSLGYSVNDNDLDHLLSQLKAVPGLTTSTAITSQSLAASQIDATQDADWLEMAHTAFNALDLDGDGTVQRSEMEVVLAGRCPENEIESAIEQAMVEAGLTPDAQSLDFAAFMRMLNADMSSEKTAASARIQKFASMRTRSIGADASASLSGVLRDACTSCCIRRRSGSSGPLTEEVWETVMPTNFTSRRSTAPEKGNSSSAPHSSHAQDEKREGLTSSLGVVEENKVGVLGTVSSSSMVFMPHADAAGGAGSGGGGADARRLIGDGFGDEGDNKDKRRTGRGYATKAGKGQKLEGMFSEGSVGSKKGSVESSVAELALT